MRAPAGIIQPNDRRAHLGRQVHDLDDLSRVRLRKRSPEHGEILGENINQPALNAPISGDESVAVNLLLGHAEVVAAVGDELVGFLERALVEQKFNALAGRHLAFFVLALAAFGAATIFGKLVPPFKFGNLLFEVHGPRL